MLEVSTVGRCLLCEARRAWMCVARVLHLPGGVGGTRCLLVHERRLAAARLTAAAASFPTPWGDNSLMMEMRTVERQRRRRPGSPRPKP